MNSNVNLVEDYLLKQIKIIDECYKDFKYDSCVKLFTHVGNVRRHIKTVHEGHKDFKCKSCEKSYTFNLKFVSVRGHIKNIHKGH